MRKIIFHADDLGTSKSFNAGILKGHLQGLITSTSIRVNGTAFHEAVNEVIPACPDLDIGLHLNIVEGKTHRKNFSQSSLLYTKDGVFKGSFFYFLLLCWNKKLLKEIEDEYTHQIEEALSHNIKISHLDSHIHSHGIPMIFYIVCKMAVKYNIPYVRLTKERFYCVPSLSKHISIWFPVNIIKFVLLNTFSWVNKLIAHRTHVKTNNYFIGILYTGFMDSETIACGLAVLPKKNIIAEVLVHPCEIVADKEEQYHKGIREYIMQEARLKELAAATDEQLKDNILLQNYTFTNYTHLNIDKNYTIDLNDRFTRKMDDYNGLPKLKAFLITDETPFYQPLYVKQLIVDCDHIDVVGAACVILKDGDPMQEHLIKNWKLIGLRKLFCLGIKSVCLRLFGYLPQFIRGDFHSSIASVFQEYSVPFKMVAEINTPDLIDFVKQLDTDVIILSTSLIFKDDLTEAPKAVTIHRHLALLPSDDGIFQAMKSVQYGDSYTGASVYSPAKNNTRGGILSQKYLPIEKGDTLDRIYKFLFMLSYCATDEALAILRKDPHTT